MGWTKLMHEWKENKHLGGHYVVKKEREGPLLYRRNTLCYKK